MSKHKKEQAQPKKTIINFPERVNALAIILIFILYTTLWIAILNIAFPKYNYVILPDYLQATYNDEVDTYLLVNSSPLNSTLESKDEPITFRHKISAYVYKKNNNNLSRVKISSSALKSDGLIEYFGESSRSEVEGTFSTSKIKTTTSDLSEDISLDKLFMKVRYDKDKTDTENKITNKVVTFSQDIFKLTTSDLNNNRFNGFKENDFVSINIKVEAASTAENEDRAIFEVKALDVNKKHIINMQSFIVTEDNTIYPLFGLYNYQRSSTFSTSINSNYATIYDYIKAKHIYVILEYTEVNGQTTTLYYKETIENL